MRKLFLSLGTILFYTSSVLAQTPYDNFAPEQGVKPMIELSEMQFKVTNTDPNSEIRYIEFDKNTLSLNLLNDDGTLLKTVQLNPEDKKFTSIDPHAEKYYSWSPYAYCMNNPLRFIDPDGRDVWELDEQGRIVRTITHDTDGNRLTYDRIDVLDDKGNLKTQTSTFELGTITQETIKDGNKSYNVFTVNGDKNAESVFEALANPDKSTIVEWSLSTFQNKKGNTLNFVSTSINGAIEYSSGYLFREYTNQGMALTRHSHNHPVDAPRPTGIWELAAGNEKLVGDIGAADYRITTTQNKFNITPVFYLYDHRNNRHIPYSRNSTLSDFGLKVPGSR